MTVPFALLLALGQSGAFSAIPPAYLPRFDPQAAAVKIDGTTITRGELAGWLWEWRGHEAVEEAVQLFLLEREAKAQSVTVSAQEADLEFARRLEEARKGADPGAFEASMRQQGFGYSRLYLRLRMDLLAQKLVEKEFRPEDHVKVSTILFATPGGSVEELQKAIQSANEAYTKLESGADWRQVLQSTGVSGTVLESGGLIGWRAVSVFPSAIQAQLREATKGKVLKPVQTQNGIQIFRVEAQGAKASPEELAELRTAYLAEARPNLMRRLKERAKIEMISN
jgi:parvulin-like peptidyl-prolyl isomerase